MSAHLLNRHKCAAQWQEPPTSVGGVAHPHGATAAGDRRAHCATSFATEGGLDMAAESTKHVLAVDLGTGGPKVALVSTDGEIIGHEFEKTELLLLPGGGAEQDPNDWWRAMAIENRANPAY